MTVVTTIILGLVYPLVVTGLAQVIFPDQANGQLVERRGKVVGSRLIGQAFSSPGYFRSRPSATAVPYDAANSAGSQYGPTNKKLIEAVEILRAHGMTAFRFEAGPADWPAFGLSIAVGDEARRARRSRAVPGG